MTTTSAVTEGLFHMIKKIYTQFYTEKGTHLGVEASFVIKETPHYCFHNDDILSLHQNNSLEQYHKANPNSQRKGARLENTYRLLSVFTFLSVSYIKQIFFHVRSYISAAPRVTDGTLVVIDCVEGVCVHTDRNCLTSSPY